MIANLDLPEDRKDEESVTIITDTIKQDKNALHDAFKRAAIYSLSLTAIVTIIGR